MGRRSSAPRRPSSPQRAERGARGVGGLAPDEPRRAKAGGRAPARPMERSIAGGGEMELEQRVSEIVIEQLGVSRDDIDAESSFTDDLGADSLDLVELVMAMEEEFGVEIPEDDSEKLQTFGDVVAYLREKLEAD